MNNGGESYEEWIERQCAEKEVAEKIAFEKVFGVPKGDSRYNTPKKEPVVPEKVITSVIDNTEIYRRARAMINTAQRRQIAYGIEKYPEPLNESTWSTIETIDHIIDESIDQLHYLVQLRIKLEKMGE